LFLCTILEYLIALGDPVSFSRVTVGPEWCVAAREADNPLTRDNRIMKDHEAHLFLWYQSTTITVNLNYFLPLLSATHDFPILSVHVHTYNNT